MWKLSDLRAELAEIATPKDDTFEALERSMAKARAFVADYEQEVDADVQEAQQYK